MKCHNCKVNISDTDKYCPRCGTLFDNRDVEMLGDTLENQLLNVYISKKKFNSNISLGYLLFNFFYAFYKKMYFEGVVGAISTAIVISIALNWKNFLLESMGFNALLIIFSFMMGVVVNIYYILRFDELYIEKAKKYIFKLVKDHGSEDMKLLTNKCEKDSKGNFLISVLPVILVIAILIFLIFIY